MAWFRRRPRASGPGGKQVNQADLEHLTQFFRSRRGVEAFIEPQTTVTETTLLLVAHDGEWTRRRIGSPDVAWRFAHQLGMPAYDIKLLGYPQRMRDYNERQKRRPA